MISIRSVIPDTKDTIAAIATPPGAGGIGIVRVSGQRAEEIGRLLFRSAKGSCPFASHHLYHGSVCSPRTGILLDEVLVTLMRSPHSYTGEHVLEIHCHGGPVILRSVLEEVIKAGARPAEPGEFTRRAFLNNRMDLSQAEAVANLITAKTSSARDAALSQLKGGLSEKVHALRASLTDLLVLLEAAVDFPDEDLEITPLPVIAGKVQALCGQIRTILATYDEGRIYREGLRVVIAGRPNVGKSSLLNKLLGEERAIVTTIPGTTRDFIEEEISIRGIPVRLTDTAGIRDAENIIEQEGIGRVWEKLSCADAVILLLDGSTDLSQQDMDILDTLRERKVLVAINKVDLPKKLDEKTFERAFPGFQSLRISAKYGQGLDRLKERIYAIATGERNAIPAEIIITNLRHKAALEQAESFLSKARDSIMSGLSPEFAALDLGEAIRSLGEIIGETAGEDILEKIFSTFCIGK